MPRQCSAPPPRDLTVVAAAPFGSLLCFLAAAAAVSSEAVVLAPAPAPAPAAAPVPGLASYLLHGTDWSQGRCSTRERQSPVNFDSHLKEPPVRALEYHYEPFEGPLALRAQAGLLTMNVSGRGLGGVLHDGAWFVLEAVDFHGPAEHLIRGVRHPLELQLRHRGLSDSTRWLVISVLVWCEHPPSPPSTGVLAASEYAPPDPVQVDFSRALAPFLNKRPPNYDGGDAALGAGLDLAAFLAEPTDATSNSYLMYSGSLTTPPCTDRALWLVRRKALVASDAQVKAFADSLYRLTGNHGSYRQVMPVNGRQVVVAELRPSAAAAPLPGAPAPSQLPHQPLPWGPNPRTDGELEATRLADAALTKAQASAQTAAAVAQRLRRADLAYSAALGSPPGAHGARREELEEAAPEQAQEAHGPSQWAASVSRLRRAIVAESLEVGRSASAALRSTAAGLRTEAAREAAIAGEMLRT